MVDIEEIVEVIREREESMQFLLGFVAVTVIAIGVEWLLNWFGVPKWGIGAIMVYFSFVGIIGLLIEKERKELAEIEALDLIDHSEKLIAFEQQNSILNSDLQAQKEQGEKLALALEADRKNLARVTQLLRVTEADLSKCEQELSTCNAELNNALASASEESTRVKELESKCKELEASESARVKDVNSRCEKIIAHERASVKELEGKCAELLPLLDLYKAMKANKEAESVMRSRNADKSISQEEREEGKRLYKESKIKLEKAYEQVQVQQV